ncbi:hypothetical protein KIN20_021926 [Parelaphostrongylus tenuis]|uniref:Uncharacterized protein n=1 Tax=Parelaphostrongylus tenuis TaxID=148309 RepID=A0AAD5N5Q1_PARTN|nr:hypothetical protein KIN20_021926 [Parelaphostrongylus tenuis]
MALQESPSQCNIRNLGNNHCWLQTNQYSETIRQDSHHGNHNILNHRFCLVYKCRYLEGSSNHTHCCALQYDSGCLVQFATLRKHFLFHTSPRTVSIAMTDIHHTIRRIIIQDRQAITVTSEEQLIQELFHLRKRQMKKLAGDDSDEFMIDK